MILVINTAMMVANLALADESKAVLRDVDAKCKHSENVLKTIDDMCEEAGVDILQVDNVAVVVGPGSFTGLRIGVSIAKALGCVNKNIKFVPLSSLEIMAYIVAKKRGVKGRFACAINALSGLVFVCEFDEKGIKLTDERMIKDVEFEALAMPKFAIAGDVTGEAIEFIEIDSASLVEFAKQKAERGEFVGNVDLLPKYLRLSQAEDNLIKKNKKV